MPDSIDINTQSFLRVLKDVNMGMFEISHKVFEEYGFPHAGMAILWQVGSVPGSTISEVARRTGLAKSNVSKTVEILVGQGFLEKRSDDSDQRLVRLYLTEQAHSRVFEMRTIMDQRLSRVLSVLPPEKVDCLLDALSMLKEALEKQEMIG